MIDLAINFDSEPGEFDLVLSGSDLMGDDGLYTAVIISLFTDTRAAEDDPLPEERPGQVSDLRGWWGDFLPDETAPVSIGSRLWLLTREKDLDEVVARAQEYAQEALKWLLDEGHVTRLEVRAARVAPGWLDINVSALEAVGTGERTREWNFFYDYQNATHGRVWS